MKRCVVILVKDGNKFLIGKRRDSNKISFPAGHINKNETPKEAAIRELKEETGLECTKLTIVKIFMPKPGVQIFVFEAKAKGKLNPNKDPDKEFSKVWFDTLNFSAENWHIPPKNNLGLKTIQGLK